jgi:hypothetical protein
VAKTRARPSAPNKRGLIGRTLHQHQFHFPDVYGLRRDHARRIFFQHDGLVFHAGKQFAVEVLTGSVSTRASKRERYQAADMEVWLCGLQDAEHRRGGAKEVEAAVIGGDDLVMGWAGAEEVAELVVASTESRR